MTSFYILIQQIIAIQMVIKNKVTLKSLGGEGVYL